jgi:16S rRNA processing protein RimM
MTAQGQTSPPAADLVFVGVVTGARGLKGEVRIRSFTGDPASIAAYGPLCDETGGQPLCVRVTGRSKDQLVVRVDGVDDRNAAEDLKGRRLFVPRAALPEPDDEEFYHVDLIGLRAERSGGETLGTIDAVHDFGAGNVLEISGGEGGSMMVPFTRAVVPLVDVAGGRVVVDPPPELPAAEQEDGQER